VESKLRCVNFRRVSDLTRALQPAFRVTDISDDWYRSTMGVIVMSVGPPRSAGENFGCTWEHRRHAWVCRGQVWVGWRQASECRQHVWEHLEPQRSSLGKTTSSLGTPLLRLEIIATTYHSTIVKTHVFSLYSPLCM